MKVLFVGINPKFLLENEIEISAEHLPERVMVVRSLIEEPDLVVCVDVDDRALKLVRSLDRKKVATVLIVSEPKVVVPLNFHPYSLQAFDRVIRIGRPEHIPILPWPQRDFENYSKSFKKNSGTAILIQSRKYSFVKGQLYGLRIQLAATDPRVFVVGHRWNESALRTAIRLAIEFSRALGAEAEIDFHTFRTAFLRPVNILGPADSKTVAMEDFKVAVVIENSQEYMSEKLFDALVAGCIPVYVGPDLSQFGIPPTLFVRAEATVESVKLGISKALDMDYLAWHKQAIGFLSDYRTKKLWNGSTARFRILDAVFSPEN